MNTLRKLRSCVSNVFVCSRTLNDDPVVSGLSITPSDIERLARQGVPVSVPSANQFLPADTQIGWDVPPEFQRDMDRNSAWELQESTRLKLLNRVKHDKKLYH